MNLQRNQVIRRCAPALFLLAMAFPGLAVARRSNRMGAAQAAPAKAAGPAQTNAGLDEAKSLTMKGDLPEAEKATRQFLQANDTSAEAHFLLGYILFREIQAKAEANGATRYDVDGSLARFRDEHAKASLAEFTEGAKYHEPSEFDLKTVAEDYVLLNDFGDADKWMTRAVEWNPKDAEAWYSLGRIKYTNNRFQEAIHAFEECLKLDPKNVKAEDNLGLSYYGLGRTDDALKAYKTAIEWQAQAKEKDPQPFIDLGTLYIEKNQPKEALPYLEQAAQVAPGDAKGHEELGKAHSALNDLPKAQSEFEKAVSLAPNVARLHYMLGQIYRREGMMDKAKEQFARVAELNGTHSSEDKPID